MVATVLSDFNGQPISMEENRAYLNREQSECIKGILIILIVLGHNHILCPNTVSGGLMEYLYTFHVAGFFILPFFYQSETKTSWTKAGNTIIRCWVPYFWICLCCWLSYSIVSHHFEFGFNHIVAFFQGTQTPIRRSFGFVFPWFLPTYCSLSIMLLVAKKYQFVFVLQALLGCATFMMSWMEFYIFKNTVPFGAGLALNYFASGAITFAIHRYVKYGRYIGAFVFVALSVCWWLKLPLGVLYHFMPATFFLLLLCIAPLIDHKWLQMLGKHSLGIYLFHVFFINALERLLPPDLWCGWLIFPISLLIPMMISYYINQYGTVRSFLFPKSGREFLSFYKRR